MSHEKTHGLVYIVTEKSPAYSGERDRSFR